METYQGWPGFRGSQGQGKGVDNSPPRPQQLSLGEGQRELDAKSPSQKETGPLGHPSPTVDLQVWLDVHTGSACGHVRMPATAEAPDTLGAEPDFRWLLWPAHNAVSMRWFPVFHSTTTFENSCCP